MVTTQQSTPHIARRRETQPHATGQEAERVLNEPGATRHATPHADHHTTPHHFAHAHAQS